MTFSVLGLRPDLLHGITKLGFKIPTPVQAVVIPAILNNGRDLVALAQTGTGKTAAFGLPLLQLLDASIKTPQALILCPTRELCMQIARDLESFATGMRGIRVLAVYGGADIQPQLAAMARGVEVVVATPGRMVDLLHRKRADFSKIQRVVLDEADEMLNMGFEEDLETILSAVPKDARKLLFSATMPREVAAIARKYMRDPEEITLGTRNAGADHINHEYYVVHAKDRYRALKRIADFYPDMYSIVFCRTRQETQDLADHLSKDGYHAEPLHGELTQQQRDRVMKKFRARGLQMLVATDVAARGLDVNDLTHIINYSLPDDLDGYTHRSGRTGRAGKTGVSIVLINMREHGKIARIEKQLGRKFVKRAVPTGADICKVRLLGLMDKLKPVEPNPGLIDEVLPMLCESIKDLTREELLRRFASLELNQLLAYYSHEPDLNTDETYDVRHGSGDERYASRDRRTSSGKMVEMVMNVGHVNGLTPKKLICLINVADRDSRIEIGRINISKMQSYFEIPRAAAQAVVDGFTQRHMDLDGRSVQVAYAGDGNANRRDEQRGASPYRSKDKRRKG